MMNTVFLGPFGMGAPEMIIIGVILLLLFGGKKIPELMRGLGKGMREFKDASKGVTDGEDTTTPKSEK